MRTTVSSRRRARVLYAGVVVFIALALLTARSIFVAWHTRSGEARAEAILNLVAQRTPSRPTDAPGAMAWLRLELDRYEQRIPDARRAALYRSLAASSERVPDALSQVADELRAGQPGESDRGVKFQALWPSATPSLRRTRLVTFDGHTLVVTRRRALDDESEPQAVASDRVLRSLVPLITERRAALARVFEAHPLPAVPGDRAPRPVRLYVVTEDGTLVSEPWDSSEPGSAA